MGENLHDTGFGSDFLDLTPIATKAKSDKLIIRIKNFVRQRTPSTD